MTLLEVYNGMKENLAQMEPMTLELQKKIEEHKAKIKEIETESKLKIDEHQSQIDEAAAELKKIQDIVESLNLSKETLETTVIEEKKEVSTVDDEKKKREADRARRQQAKEFSTWTTKNPKLVKMDRNGRELGRYNTQKAAAREMGWDQSSMSRFLKFNKDQQLMKKNFYFTWVH